MPKNGSSCASTRDQRRDRAALVSATTSLPASSPSTSVRRRRYPDGLAGEAIPRSPGDVRGRLLRRHGLRAPYRPGLTYSQCLGRTARLQRTQFDPAMVDVFLRVLEVSNGAARRITGIAVGAARLIDPDKHALLRTRSTRRGPSTGRW